MSASFIYVAVAIIIIDCRAIIIVSNTIDRKQVEAAKEFKEGDYNGKNTQ